MVRAPYGSAPDRPTFLCKDRRQPTVSGSHSAMQTSASHGLQRVVVMGWPTKQFVGVGAGLGVGVALGVIVVCMRDKGRPRASAASC